MTTFAERHTDRRHDTSGRGAAPPGAAGYLTAAAFAASAIWYGLITAHVTVAAPPPGGSSEGAMRGWYTWLASTLPQRRTDIAIAVVAFFGLGWIAARLPGRAGPAGWLAVPARAATVAGAALWVVANLLQQGGQRAVGLMATHDNPIQTTNSLAFTIDTTTALLECAAFAALGAGLLGLAAGAALGRPLRWFTAVTAGFLLALAVGYGWDGGDLTDWLTVATGLAVLPAWLVWLTRL